MFYDWRIKLDHRSNNPELLLVNYTVELFYILKNLYQDLYHSTMFIPIFF